MQVLFRFFAVFVGLTLGACSQVQVDEYSDLKPSLSPRSFFDVQLTAHGMIKDRRGKVTRRFYANIQASWCDGVGTLAEHFEFDDGERQQRTWTLTPVGENTYRATAGDVVGDGTLIYAGNAMFLEYVLSIPYKGDTIDVHVDDRMYLVSPSILLNESSMIKFGVEVGSIVLVIIRQGDTAMLTEPPTLAKR